MSGQKRNHRKITRRLLLSVTSLVLAGAAASPVLAATHFVQVDKGAAALIATFTILMLGIIFEVWRFTSRRQLPLLPKNTGDWRQDYHGRQGHDRA